MKQSPQTLELKSTCIDEALKIVESEGIDKLSLRAVARRLGVSHQAPYKHFPSKEHIVAAVIARLYQEFAAYLDARPRSDDPHLDMAEMGVAYVRYAIDQPARYRLMFESPLPAAKDHPEMMLSAEHAFSLLRQSIRQLPMEDGSARDADRIEADAMFVWSVVHGTASALKSDVINTLEIDKKTREEAVQQMLQRISLALTGELPNL